MISAIVSALHMLALALGLPSIFFRGRALKGSLDGPGLHRLFTADTVWGIAALLWLATGLARAFGGLEKGSALYLASPLFWLKITLFATVALLEAWPMATFIRWRRERRRADETRPGLGDRPQLQPGRAPYRRVAGHLPGREHTDRPRAGGVVDLLQGRPALHVQAPQGHQLPRRHPAQRRGREVLDRAPDQCRAPVQQAR